MDAHHSFPPWLKWARGRASWLGKSLSCLCMAIIVIIESRWESGTLHAGCLAPPHSLFMYVMDTPSSKGVCTVKNGLSGSLEPSPWSSSCVVWQLTPSLFLKCFCNPYPLSEDCPCKVICYVFLQDKVILPTPVPTKEIIKRCLGDECKLMNHSVIKKSSCDF